MRLIIVMLFLTLLSAGCAHFPTVTNNIPIDGQIQNRAEILELAVDVAKSMNFPEVTKFDPANGIVEFGVFGGSVIGITAQVRVKSDNKSVDVTVKRGSVYIPLSMDETAKEFTKRLQEKIQEKMK